jgi:hypothetical protein
LRLFPAVRLLLLMYLLRVDDLPESRCSGFATLCEGEKNGTPWAIGVRRPRLFECGIDVDAEAEREAEASMDSDVLIEKLEHPAKPTGFFSTRSNTYSAAMLYSES